MKSLSSMSSVAKRNLSNLALQFSTKHKHTADGSTEAERDRLVMDEGVRCALCFSFFYIFVCFIISSTNYLFLFLFFWRPFILFAAYLFTHFSFHQKFLPSFPLFSYHGKSLFLIELYSCIHHLGVSFRHHSIFDPLRIPNSLLSYSVLYYVILLKSILSSSIKFCFFYFVIVASYSCSCICSHFITPESSASCLF